MISTIDTAGQYTVIVDLGIKLPKLIMAALSKIIMKCSSKIGQVSYIINRNSNKPFAYMMGGELSINGSFASGYYLMRKRRRKTLEFYTSGFSEPLRFILEKYNKAKLLIPKDILISKSRNTITLSGIGYYFIKGSKPELLNNTQFEHLDIICKSNPAGGIVFYENNKITPIVKVAKTNTISEETACSSASLALFILKNIKKVIQPSGNNIVVDRKGNTFIIKVSVKKIL